MEENKNMLPIVKEKTIKNMVVIQNKSKISFLTITTILLSMLLFTSPSFLEVIVMCFGNLICSDCIELR